MNAIIKAPLTGELLPPGETLCVVAAMHPLKAERRIVEVPVGASLLEIVGRCGAECGSSRLAKGAQVTLGGEPVPQAMWPRVRPKAGASIVVRAVPGKGMGGILKSILMIALVVIAAVVVGPLGLGLAGTPIGGLISAGIVFGGSLLLNALFPPASTSDKAKKVYSIAGSKNEVVKWGPIPALLGQTRVFPKYAAGPYTEFDGNDQYVRMLLVWGLGPIEIGELKFGETPISHYDGVEVQTFEGYATDGQQTIYPGEVVQDDFQIDITKEFSPFRRYTADEASEVVVDYVAPQGIYNLNKKKGSRGKLTVGGKVQLRDPDTGEVLFEKTWDFTAKSVDPIRRSRRFKDLPGNKQYEVFFIRDTQDYDDDEDDDKVDTVMWTALRTIRKSPPIEYRKPLAITAIRIKATKQLNGVPDEVNAVCTSRMLAWNGTAWVGNQATRSPADIFRHVLQGPGNARPVPDTRLDLPTIQAWGDYCKAKGFTFDMYRDFNSSVADTLRDVCAAGRAVPIFRDGKWSVAWEEANAPIVQHFTPRNSRDFSWTQTYRDLPHALRVKFVNAKRGYIEDERLVYDDGYDKATSTLFEQAEFPGVQDPDLVFKHGRYRIADAKLRPAIYRLTVDFEHLVCTRGDRVRVAHDVIQVGLHQGRIKAVSGLTVTLDEQVFMEAGKAYGMTIRRKDGSSVVRSVTTKPGWQDTVTLSSAGAEVGALFMFGHPDEQTDVMRIMAIRPGEDLSAELELVDDAPGIQNADTGPIIGDDGSVITPPPLAQFRPYDLSALQFLDTANGFTTQITRLFWKIPPGAPQMSSFLVVGIDTDGKEYRASTPDGATFSLDFLNLPSSDYVFMVQGFTTSGLYTGFSEPFYLSQTLPEDDIGFDFDAIQDEFQAAFDKFITEAQADLDERVELLRGEIDDLAKQAVGVVVQEETTNRQTADESLGQRIDTVQAVADGAAARVTEEQTARINADEALGQQIDTVAAVAGNAAAAVQTEQKARVAADNALSSSVTAALAQSNLATASGMYKLETTASANGRARFLVFLNAGTKDNPNWASTGMLMEAWIEGGQPRSRILMKTDSFAIHNGAGAQAIPFIVTNGQVVIDTAYIRFLDAGNIAINGVDMANLIAGAATAGGSSKVSGAFNVTAQFSLTVAAGVVNLFCMAKSPGGQIYQATIYRNGSALLRINPNLARVTELFTDNPGVGTHTYQFQCSSQQSNVGIQIDFSGINLRR